MEYLINKFLSHRLWALILPFALAINHSALGQQPTWRLAVGTEGAQIGAIDFFRGNPDTVLALGDVVFLSTDRGETWDTLSDHIRRGLLSAIRIHPWDSKRVFASHRGPAPGANAVSVSTDGGISWALKLIGIDYYAPVIEISHQNPATVFAGRGSTFLMRSTDFGETWETLLNDPFAWGLRAAAISPQNDSIIYRADLLAAFKSTNRGMNWTVVRDFVNLAEYSSVLVHPHDPGRVYLSLTSYTASTGGVFMSTDSGASWQDRNVGLPRGNTISLAMDPKHPDRLYAGGSGVETNDLVYHSTNGGLSWLPIGSGLPAPGNVRCIAIDSVENKILICVSAGNASGIYILDHSTSVLREIENRPVPILQNTPNPFNNSTRISWHLPTPSYIRLDVCNIMGQRIRVLEEGHFQPGEHVSEWQPRDIPSGVYFSRLITKSGTIICKMLLIK